MVVPYPPLQPFDTGLLTMPDHTQVYWELSGNPLGKPALFLHGGPGSGLGAGGYRSGFDPERYLIVGIDQRGCGRSRPLVIDSLDQLPSNTTQAIIADIEAVRTHLDVERWLVSGISWGTTLALAYALAHPDRVTELILAAVTTTSRAEVDWITETVGRLFPEAWARLDAQSCRRPGERVVEAYARRLALGDDDDRDRAAQEWDDWESVHISLDPNWRPGPLHEDPVRRLVFATLVTHYWAHDGFLPSGGTAILERVEELAGIPAVLIHGRRDVSGPAVTPWLLNQAWPASELVIIESEGHGGPLTTEAICSASDAFAT
ncbi:prolyl aminopeptidase [Cryobacterium sp. N22]|uniref:prolyl aminopeptidase n=1 Tax=Cryobacterium sp. N22 TaxID=2048290 RepID=UPI000CE346FE|nr:prolyl aminopeptidase [Cryobacterium sp. N22]